MALLLTILLLAGDPSSSKVAELGELLRKGDTAASLALLREIGTLKGNHEEALALIRLVRTSRVPKPPEVLEACFVALKGIGSAKATRPLVALLKVRPLKKDPIVRVGVCRALEGSADPAGVETILDLLRDPEDRVVAAAAEAAGAYRFAKASIRKELFEDLVDIYVGTWNLKNSVNPDLKTEKRRAEQKWELIEKPTEKTLQLLSNVTQNDPPAWRRWWNKNKNRRWETLEDQ